VIVSRTPLRISFFGGGSDLPSFYRRGRGAVLSTTIDKYIYVSVHKNFDPKLLLAKYSRTERGTSAGDICHPLIRESLRAVGIDSGVEICSSADIPGGTGLGSSSSFTVGLLRALRAYRDLDAPPADLAREACDVEITGAESPIGKQDQYAAAFGGFNLIEFHSDDAVSVTPVGLQEEVLFRLGQKLMLFYTEMRRDARVVLADQLRRMGDEKTCKEQEQMVAHVDRARKLLVAGDLDKFGGLLHDTWELKCRLSSRISNPTVDDAYARARAAGALGGKLLGAGGGGFLLLYCPEPHQEAVRSALVNYREMEFAMAGDGAQLVYDDT